MYKRFFELVQVAIGIRNGLSRQPSHKEWETLYDIAKKQSLVGVCFAGLQRLGADADEGFARIGMNEMLYLIWMGMAAKIQQKNEIVNHQCIALQKRLSADGLRCCILKGQGVATLYRFCEEENLDLSMLRQSGDIDVYVQGGQQKVMEWCKRLEPSPEYDYVHTNLNVFEDTEVEIHYRYGYLYNLVGNHKLQKWFSENERFEEVNLPNGVGYISVPSAAFNVIYQLHHIYRHLFVEGIGLRQLMDYYFVLKTFSNSPLKGEDMKETLSSLNMLKFASAVMFVLQEVFNMEEKFIICEPNEKEGRYLLDRIMHTGNFGQKHKREKKKGGMCTEWMGIMKHSMHLALHYPLEALGAPIWHVYHFFWKRTSGRI